MNKATKEDRMFVKRLLKGITTVGVLLLFLVMGRSASAESYSLTNQIGGLLAPQDVAVGPDGRVYITDQSNRRILQVDEYGDFLTQCVFGSPSQPVLPLAIAVAPDGQVYYATRFSSATSDIIRFSSPDSCDFTQIGTPSGFSASFGLAVAPDNSVFVSDTVNNRILKFGADGTFIKMWGTLGNGIPDPVACSQTGTFCDAQFFQPKGMAIFAGSVLLVADTGNNRIQAFDLDGNFLLATGSQGTVPVQFNSPDGVAAGPDGSIFVSDTGNNKVEKYGSDGTLLAEIGSGILSAPEGLSVDRGENVYVTDSNNARIAVFSPDLVVFDNGADSKVVTGHDPITVTLNITPDAYWQNAPAFEVFLWVEAPIGKAYWAGLPLNIVPFSSPTEMRPLLTQNSGLPPVNMSQEFVSDSSGLQAGTYTLHLCIDRDVNGTFNPSASTCGSINVVRQ